MGLCPAEDGLGVSSELCPTLGLGALGAPGCHGYFSTVAGPGLYRTFVGTLGNWGRAAVLW